VWSRIQPRCPISLGKSIVVAFSNSRSPREYEFAMDTFCDQWSQLIVEQFRDNADIRPHISNKRETIRRNIRDQGACALLRRKEGLER